MVHKFDLSPHTQKSPTKTLTLAEFLQLPETKPASEYINGRVVQKPMPQGKHSTIQGELIIAINAAAKTQRIAWAFPELRCNFGGRSVVPDVVVFAWERIPLDEDGDVAKCLKLILIGRLRFSPQTKVRLKSPETFCTASNTAAV